MYHVLYEAKCDRCGRTYSSSTHPSIDRWTQVSQEHLGGNEYPYDPERSELCGPCSSLYREFIENYDVIPVSKPTDPEPSGLALWERELLANPEDTAGPSILDALEDILYPMDGYRDDQWNGGDVCEAVADLLRRYRPQAHLRQPEAPEDEACGARSWDGTGIGGRRCELPAGHEGGHSLLHKHEWRWSNRLPGYSDGITRRYCMECGVLFSDL